MIARLLGLCLIVLAAFPASAEVRVEGLAKAAAKGTHGPGIGRLIPSPGRLVGLDESEHDLPSASAFAAGCADGDQPELDAVAAAGADPIPARGVTEIAPSRPVRAPPRHRACAAPPTGPPAALT